jgi:hypothetical protein
VNRISSPPTVGWPMGRSRSRSTGISRASSSRSSSRNRSCPASPCSPMATSPTRTGFDGWSRASVDQHRPTVLLPDGAEVHAPIFSAAPVARADHRRRLDVGRSEQRHHGQAGPPGPYTMARLARTGGHHGGARARSGEALNVELLALAAAGCPIIQIDEGALRRSATTRPRGLYAETQRRLTAGSADQHLSLGLNRGGIHPAGHATVLTARTSAIWSTRSAGPTPGVSSSPPAGDRRCHRCSRRDKPGARRDRGDGLGDGLVRPRSARRHVSASRRMAASAPSAAMPLAARSS